MPTSTGDVATFMDFHSKSCCKRGAGELSPGLEGGRIKEIFRALDKCAKGGMLWEKQES